MDANKIELNAHGGGEKCALFSDDWFFFVGVSIGKSNKRIQVYFVICDIACSCFAGVMSGLTIGILSINMLDLEIKTVIGNAEEIRQAKVVMNILQHHHWLLVTLLFCNACALEALPIFLDRIVPSAYAILISVVAVLIVGEVIPQAICIGPRQL